MKKPDHNEQFELDLQDQDGEQMGKSVNICCPKCNRVVIVALPTVASYSDPKFVCKCGQKKLSWTREK